MHCYTQNIKALGLMVLEKKIFFDVIVFFHCMNREPNDTRSCHS